MSGYSGMHRAQVKTLDYLRRHQQARFSELAGLADMTSDNYKFHVRRLSDLGYLQKAEDGQYELTASGKSFANRLNPTTGTSRPDPKASMLLIVSAQQDGETYYLVQRRTRQPFYDYYGIPSAPVEVGVSITDTATSECYKQTGLRLDFTHRGTLRVIDRKTSGDILEDKFFSLMQASAPSLEEFREWAGGKNYWRTRSEMLALEPLFASTEATLDMLDDQPHYSEYTCIYADDEY